MNVQFLLCVVYAVLLSNSALGTEKTVSKYQFNNTNCDYPIQVSSGKVIHLELRNVKENNHMRLYRDLNKFAVMILDLNSERGDLDVITSTNKVCVQLGPARVLVEPSVIIRFGEVDPVVTTAGNVCGAHNENIFGWFMPPDLKTTTRTYVLCDNTYHIEGGNAIAIVHSMSKPYGVVFDLFQQNTEFGEYPVESIQQYNRYIFKSSPIRVRQRVLIDGGQTHGAHVDVSEFHRLNTTNGYCGQLLEKANGTLYAPAFPYEFRGLVVCDFIIRVKQPSKLNIKINEFSARWKVNVLLSARSMDGAFIESKSKIKKGDSITGPVKSNVVVRFEYPVVNGYSASLRASYKVEPTAT